jgi:hypothetical protein
MTTSFFRPLLLLTLAVSLLSFAPPKKQSGNSWKKLQTPTYSLQYPESWSLDTTGIMNTTFVVLAPLEGIDDAFKENINLIIQDLEGYSIDLNQYTNLSEEDIKTNLTNTSILESARIKKGKSEHHKLVFNSDQEDLELSFIQYYWVQKDRAYVLTYSCERNKLQATKATAEKVMNSFKINR